MKGGRPARSRLRQPAGVDSGSCAGPRCRMAEIEAEEAARQLSGLLRRVAAGEEIVITRAARPVARLVPVEPKPRRILGQDEGLFEVPDDFDAPLPDDVLARFEP